MFKQITLALAATALIAGCSSPVKLDNAPVEDRGTAGSGSGANSGSMGQSGVTPVDLNATATAQGPVGVARIVYFDYDSYTVKPEFQSMIEQHSRFLKANPNRRVSIEGNTDERGGHEYNLALGQKRSEAVRRALTLLGVSDSQVEAVSFGSEKPASTTHDEAGWAQNRRAEFSYR
ncbi:peptidoglycan-associated lipoprotein Pal [Xylophilus sp. GOD-11R]|uniref:peptidoglycan-associated lipoprotein Pal n=1 Tax=Xylophilus sp. GOD-11R TaxID=3089814 RepID=UPI00298CF85F|nr:peptidoglycan-associated lipoprotein Pal [Xylophilus sp. GOD-11R]WPB55215.1 peptidoglycan-associated lipoprotein Pal [Xylophilus sp. GOD-11R]